MCLVRVLEGQHRPIGRVMPFRQTAASELKGVNAPEDMQFSACGQRSLDLGGSIPESLIEVTNTLSGPKMLGDSHFVVNRVLLPSSLNSSLGNWGCGQRGM